MRLQARQLKGQLTKLVNTTKVTLTRVTGHEEEFDKTNATAIWLTRKRQAIEALQARLFVAYEELRELPEVQADVANLKQYTDLQAAAEKLGNDTVVLILIPLANLPDADIEDQQPAPVVPTPQHNRPIIQARANLALKPDPLSLDHTPVELRAWISKFTAFYRTSNLQLLTTEDQQAYLLSYLNSTLCLLIEGKLEPAIEMFGDRSCISILEDTFRERFPLFQRREVFFSASFSSNIKELPSFLTKLEGLADVAELEDLDKEGLIAYKALSSISDVELRRLCAREEALTLPIFRALALQRVREAETLDKSRTAESSVNAINGNNPHAHLSCHFCHKLGHTEAECYKKKREQREQLGGAPARGPVRGGQSSRGRPPFRGHRSIRAVTDQPDESVNSTEEASTPSAEETQQQNAPDDFQTEDCDDGYQVDPQ